MSHKQKVFANTSKRFFFHIFSRCSFEKRILMICKYSRIVKGGGEKKREKRKKETWMKNHSEKIFLSSSLKRFLAWIYFFHYFKYLKKFCGNLLFNFGKLRKMLMRKSNGWIIIIWIQSNIIKINDIVKKNRICWENSEKSWKIIFSTFDKELISFCRFFNFSPEISSNRNKFHPYFKISSAIIQIEQLL